MNDQLSTVVDVRNVSKTYAGHVALADASFSIAQGECFALLGPNGAGKTTLLRMLTNILKPDTGSVSVFGESRDLAVVKDRIGYLPEERGLYKKEKIVDTLTYFGQLKGMSPARARTRAGEVLESVGMASHAGAKPETLSKGMAQRVQFAAALVHDPEFVIFDEPFSGLDPVSAYAMQELLLAEKARGRTLLLSTHQMNPVERLCDRLLMLRGGQVMLYGAMEEIRARYSTGGVRVEHEGLLPEIPGVGSVSDEPGVTRLLPPDDMTPNALLRRLVDSSAVLSGFAVETPSLEYIFRRVVGEGVDADAV
jgi:ABC-2 type transport system ATP-binding protein